MGQFLPFYSPNSPKNQNFKKNILKKRLEISSLYTNVPKIMIICYTVPEIWCMTDVIVIFHFGLFFALLPPPTPSNSPTNQKKKKKKKTPGNIIILHMCTKNNDQMMYGSWDMVHNRWTDRVKKWHIEVGAPPKNLY